MECVVSSSFLRPKNINFKNIFKLLLNYCNKNKNITLLSQINQYMQDFIDLWWTIMTLQNIIFFFLILVLTSKRIIKLHDLIHHHYYTYNNKIYHVLYSYIIEIICFNGTIFFCRFSILGDSSVQSCSTYHKWHRNHQKITKSMITMIIWIDLEYLLFFFLSLLIKKIRFSLKFVTLKRDNTIYSM